MDSWYIHVLQKRNSQASSLYTVVFLSIDTIVFFSQPLTFPTVFADFQAAFLQHHVSVVRNTIVYRDIKFYCSNIKTLCFLKKVVFCIHDTFHSATPEPSNKSLPFFHCRTIKHRYTNFRSYHDFHKMRDVPGFCSVGHVIFFVHIQLNSIKVW